MKTAARVFLVFVAFAILGVSVAGWLEVHQEHGLWVALAVLPGIPLGALIVLFAIATAFEDEK